MERQAVSTAEANGPMFTIWRTIPMVSPDAPRPLRNGLPEFKPYIYRGKGYDILDPFGHGTIYAKGDTA